MKGAYDFKRGENDVSAVIRLKISYPCCELSVLERPWLGRSCDPGSLLAGQSCGGCRSTSWLQTALPDLEGQRAVNEGVGQARRLPGATQTSESEEMTGLAHRRAWLI